MTPEQRETLAQELERVQLALRAFPKAAGHYELAEALRAALSLPPTCGTWQPIETAPKMRKVIVHYLNALGKHRVVMACYYLANALEMDDDYAEVGTYDEATGNSYAPEGWYEEHDSDNPIMGLEGEPTHWMPVPAAPTEPTR